MRVNSKNWIATCGVKTGHYHLYKGANCQDAAAIVAGPDMVAGIGCDGCGEGNHSELGAIATTNFALREILRLRRQGYGSRTIVEHLFPAIVRFIDMNIFLTCPVETPVEVADFIKHHWLCTLMGFILFDEPDDETEQRGMIFWCGDGVISSVGGAPRTAVQESHTIIDQDNAPTYIAYNCVRSPSEVGVEPHHIPKSFSCCVIDNFTARVMIASDGFDHHNPDKLLKSRENDPDLPGELFGQQWSKKGQTGLQRWMNSRSDRGFFHDDCFIITAELPEKVCEPQ